MQKTKVLMITPGTVSDRLREDLNIKWTVREEALPKFQKYIDALEHYSFFYASYISQPKEEMLKYVDEIITDWPGISCAVYLDPDTPEGGFYHASILGTLKKGNVGVEDFITALNSHGIASIPMQMDFDDSIFDSGEISIRGYYEQSLEIITSIPRAGVGGHE